MLDIDEIAKSLEGKKDLTPIEKEFLNTYKSGNCDMKQVRELQLKGRGHYIERSYKHDMKETAQNFKKDVSDWRSLTGKWSEAPPRPPKFPSDCCIM